MIRWLARWLFFVALLHLVGWSWYTWTPGGDVRITVLLDLVAAMGAAGFGGAWTWEKVFHGTADARSVRSATPKTTEDK